MLQPWQDSIHQTRFKRSNQTWWFRGSKWWQQLGTIKAGTPTFQLPNNFMEKLVPGFTGICFWNNRHFKSNRNLISGTLVRLSVPSRHQALLGGICHTWVCSDLRPCIPVYLGVCTSEPKQTLVCLGMAIMTPIEWPQQEYLHSHWIK